MRACPPEGWKAESVPFLQYRWRIYAAQDGFGFERKRPAKVLLAGIFYVTHGVRYIVVLGGDSPLGLPLILDLEKKGYIVVASVSTPEAVNEIESKCHGYVRALVLDPAEVCAIFRIPMSN